MHDTEYRQHRDPHRILVLPVFRTRARLLKRGLISAHQAARFRSQSIHNAF